MNYFEKEDFTLYKGECINLIKTFPDNSVDLVFADPPYFLSNNGFSCKAGKMVSVNKADWDKSNGFEKDFEFTYNWLKEVQRILNDNGSIWISGTMHNIYQVGFSLQKLNFKILNEISWFKPNASPNLSCRYFTHSHETLIWAKKNKNSKHKFNYSIMKEWNDRLSNSGKQMRSVWTIPLTSKFEKNKGYHPTQKPIELLKRIILSTSNKGDVVLDPFNGSGTTGLVSQLYGRKYIGIDINSDYLDLTIKRVNSINKKPI